MKLHYMIEYALRDRIREPRYEPVGIWVQGPGPGLDLVIEFLPGNTEAREEGPGGSRVDHQPPGGKRYQDPARRFPGLPSGHPLAVPRHTRAGSRNGRLSVGRGVRQSYVAA